VYRWKMKKDVIKIDEESTTQFDTMQLLQAGMISGRAVWIMGSDTDPASDKALEWAENHLQERFPHLPKPIVVGHHILYTGEVAGAHVWSVGTESNPAREEDLYALEQWLREELQQENHVVVPYNMQPMVSARTVLDLITTTKGCPKHPGYRAKRKPRSCAVCQGVYEARRRLDDLLGN
jgi:hypothetical protein